MPYLVVIIVYFRIWIINAILTTLSLNLKKYTISVSFFAVILGSFSYGQDKKENYFRFIDSANIYIDDHYKKALTFLDSVPHPIEKTLHGRLAEYYSLKALIHDGENELAKLYHSYVLSLKYAEKEKNYKLAGQTSLELFANSYYAKRDTSSYRYLEKAKKYYALCNYKDGLLEIKQTYEYIKFIDGDYEACNNLIFKNIDDYRNLKEDAYYIMFASYMLTSNYVYLGDLEKAHNYFNEFKSLKNNPTIVKYNYLSFKASIDACFADIYFEKKQLDSTYHYLKELKTSRNYMVDDVIKDYYKLNADVYKHNGEIELSKIYIDSLLHFEEKMFGNMVDANYQINDSIIRAEAELESESKKKTFNGWLVVFLLLVLVATSIFYFLFYRKHKFNLNELKDQENNFSYLKSNNERLNLKLHGLEGYIKNLKNDVKEISAIDVNSNQREKIKQLYSDLHFNAATLLDKNVSHTELVNDLNIEFFRKIKDKYPQLNDSEIIICYYLFIGFKNKKIALFLNTTVRAIESKRYRISKKIDFNRNETTLIDHLTEIFKDTKKQ